MINNISLVLKSTNVNGWPKIKINVDNDVIFDDQIIESQLVNFYVLATTQSHSHVVTIERYGKTEENCVIDLNNNVVSDQYVELAEVKVDGIVIPDMYIRNNSKFEFNQLTYEGSTTWMPNGIWSWTFKSPIITHILDWKIYHEAKYTDDYKYPWSYKLGPDTVDDRLKKIDQVLAHINEVFNDQK